MYLGLCVIELVIELGYKTSYRSSGRVYSSLGCSVVSLLLAFLRLRRIARCRLLLVFAGFAFRIFVTWK